MKNKWKSPAFLAFAPVFLGFILTVIYDYAKENPLFSTIFSILKSIWRWIISFLNYKIKIWWLLLGIVLIVFVFIIFLYIRKNLEDETEPPFSSYTRDIIDGWNIEWHWEKRYDNKYDAVGIHPICRNCGTPLGRLYGNYGPYKCYKCGIVYDQDWAGSDTYKMVILDNVRKEKYPKTIQNNV